MAKIPILVGSTPNYIADIFIRDSSKTDGSGLAGLVFNTASLTAYYARADQGNAGGTAITLATATLGTWATGGFKEKDATNMPGVYEFGVPTAVFASGAKSAVVMLKGAANMAPCTMEFLLTGYDPYDGVRMGLTALPAAAAEAAGGLYTRGTGAGQINQDANGRIDSNAKAYAGTTIGAPATAGIPDVNAKAINNVAATSVTTISAVIGTATAGSTAAALATVQADTDDIQGRLPATLTANGNMKSSLVEILTTALTETAGLLAGGFKKFFNVSSPTGTLNSIPDAVPDASGGLPVTGNRLTAIPTIALVTTVTNLTNAPTAGDLTATMKTSVTTAATAATPIAASVSGNVSGNVTGSVGSVATGGITAASIADGAIDNATFAVDTGLQTIRSNTAQSVTGTTIVLDASASATDSYYNDQLVYITGGTLGVGQLRLITGYVGATKTATIAQAWTTTPTGTITFAILPNRPGAVWDAVTASHLTAGSTGLSLNSAGSAGDPWATTLPGAYIAGSAGKIVGDNLNAKVGDVKAKTDSLTFTGANKVDASVRDWVGDTIPARNVTGVPIVDTKYVTGTLQTARDIGASVIAASISSGGIAAASFAAGAINAAAIATDAITAAKIAADAIGASELAADAVTEIATAILTTPANKLTTDGSGNVTVAGYASGQAPLQPTTAGRTLDVSTTGEAGLDFDNIKDATGAHALTNITVPVVTTVGTLTTYTGNTPQTGDAFLRIGAAGVSLSAIPDEAGVTTLLSRLSSARAGYLDNLSAGAVALNSDMATLLSRLSSLRAGYLDNLNVGGNVASSTEVTAIQNNTRVVRVVPEVIERPDSGTVTYRIELYLYDDVGNMEAPDSAPTIALVNQAGTDRSSRLDSTTMALVETGRYRAIYTASSADTLEQLVWAFSVVEGGATRKYGNQSVIVDTTAVDFTASDRTNLSAIFAKLPSKTYLTGSNNSDGDIQLDEATGVPVDSAGVGTLLTRLSSLRGGYLDNLSAGAVAQASALATVQADTDDIQARLPAALISGRMDASVGAYPGNTAQTGDAFLRLGTPAGASVSVDIAAIKTETASIQADTDNIQTRIPTALVGGRMDASVGAVANDAITAAAIAADAGTEIGTAVWATTTRALTDKAGFSLAAGSIAAATFAAGAVDAAALAADAGTEIATAVWASGTRALTDKSGFALTSGEEDAIVDKVWDELLSGHAVSGSTGAALAAAGSAGDPWSTILPGSYGATTAGGIVGNNLNAKVGDVKAKTDNLPADPADESNTQATLATIAAALATVQADTDDIQANIGTPASTVSADIAAVKADTSGLRTDYSMARAAKLDFLTGDAFVRLGVAGAGLTSVPWNPSWDAEVQSEVDDALVAQRLDELLNADSDIDGAQPPAVGSVFHEALTKTAGSFTYDQATDSLEALRDRGDSGAWGGGGGTADWTAAEREQIRDALGIDGSKTASAGGLLQTVASYVDSEVAAIKVKTDQLGFTGGNVHAHTKAKDSALALSAQEKLDTNTEADAALADAGYSLARAGYLDKINVSGLVASQTDVLNVSNNTRVRATIPQVIERPDSGSESVPLVLELYDSIGNMEGPDSSPTVTLADQSGADISSRVSALSNPSTGRYTFTYTNSAGNPLEVIRWTVTVVEGGTTRTYSYLTQLVDTTAVDFTAADRTKLDGVFAKLPSKSFLAGSNNSDGDIQLNEATGALATGSITADSIGADAIGASELAADAVAEIAAAVGAGSCPTVDEIIDGVLDELLSGHTVPGSVGAGIAAAGSAGDPWSTVGLGGYAEGTAGRFVFDRLDVDVGTRASQVSVDDLFASGGGGDINDAISANAAGPKEVEGDEGRVLQHDLNQQIAADRYQKSKESSKSKSGGLIFRKMTPPGTSGC